MAATAAVVAAPDREVRPKIIPLGWGWIVRFPCGSEFCGENGGPLSYRECGAAIDRWRAERERVEQQVEGV